MLKKKEYLQIDNIALFFQWCFCGFHATEQGLAKSYNVGLQNACATLNNCTPHERSNSWVYPHCSCLTKAPSLIVKTN